MTTRPCHGCTNHLDATAISCPRCGAVVQPLNAEQLVAQQAANLAQFRKRQSLGRVGGLMVLVGFAVAAIGAEGLGGAIAALGMLAALWGFLSVVGDAPGR